MQTVIAVVLVFALSAGIVLGASAGIAKLFQLLWNYAAVSAFHAPHLDFWHAWALWILIGIAIRLFRPSKNVA
jgi:low affinity Fe/Cu permease